MAYIKCSNCNKLTKDSMGEKCKYCKTTLCHKCLTDSNGYCTKCGEKITSLKKH